MRPRFGSNLYNSMESNFTVNFVVGHVARFRFVINRVRDHSYETVSRVWLRERWPCLLNGQVTIVLLIFVV